LRQQKSKMASLPLQPRMNIKIHPFGRFTMTTQDCEEQLPEKQNTPIYGELGTTNIDSIDITFSGDVYKPPKTTGGIF